MRKTAVLLALLLLLTGCAGAALSTTEGRTTEVEPITTRPASHFACDAAFFGDSITADSSFETFFPGQRIVNLGVYGDTLSDLLRRVPEVQAENPARVFLLGGINALKDDNGSACLLEYRNLLEALQTACPDAQIVVQSVLPVGAELQLPMGCHNSTIRRFNAELASLAQAHGCLFADLYSAYEKDGALDPALTRDGVHLNFTAYGPWAEVIAPLMGED